MLVSLWMYKQKSHGTSPQPTGNSQAVWDVVFSQCLALPQTRVLLANLSALSWGGVAVLTGQGQPVHGQELVPSRAAWSK